jgi:hypothetical protein
MLEDARRCLKMLEETHRHIFGVAKASLVNIKLHTPRLGSRSIEEMGEFCLGDQVA